MKRRDSIFGDLMRSKRIRVSFIKPQAVSVRQPVDDHYIFSFFYYQLLTYTFATNYIQKIRCKRDIKGIKGGLKNVWLDDKNFRAPKFAIDASACDTLTITIITHGLLDSIHISTSETISASEFADYFMRIITKDTLSRINKGLEVKFKILSCYSGGIDNHYQTKSFASQLVLNLWKKFKIKVSVKAYAGQMEIYLPFSKKVVDIESKAIKHPGYLFSIKENKPCIENIVKIPTIEGKTSKAFRPL